jgi:surface antigen
VAGVAGGCSVSYQLGSLFGKDDEAATTTGSIAADKRIATPMAASPHDADLEYARAAASAVLGNDRKDASMPWENPRTGARGTVTPLATAYNQDGLVCRDFLASYVRDGSEAWLQGAACQKQPGRWEVRSLTPWKRS